MSGGLPRVTFDGGGLGVYISYIHLFLGFYTWYTCLRHTYIWVGLFPKIQH